MVKAFSLLAVVVFIAGCGLQARTYVMTKERVGIEKGSGNAGYLAGTPQYMEPQKKTRQIYVLEITKPVPGSEAASAATASMSTAASEPAPTASEPAPTVPSTPTPPVAELPQAVTSPTLSKVTTYTVQKDDTLQKIAKKFYGSYGKWVKIYEANKKHIKNPNYLRPGMVITIPSGK